MTSLFGFSIATSGLAAQQRALETISHNIANANTPGFSRQSTAITPAEPMKVSGRRAGMVGTGANATTISRQRNGFLDLQYRNENTKLAENQTLADTLAKVEGVFGEPSESGLRTMTERYWTAWQDLSLNPESIAARGSVAEAGQALATSLNSVASNIQQYREDLNLRVKNTVTDINILSSQIASLNKQISAITSLGQQPNDLKDQRDLAVDKLSALVEVRTQDNEDGSIKVTAAGRVLVEGAESVPMGTELKGTEGFVDITSYGVALLPNEMRGELKALVDLRDKITAPDDPSGILYKINQMAKGMADAINTQHRAGFDLNGDKGEDFFVSLDGNPIGAGNIQVNPHLLTGTLGLNKLAASASATAGKGDNSNVMKIIAIKTQNVLSGGRSTIDDYYKEIITSIGVQTQAANRMVTNQKNLLEFVDGQRESNSGVNLDQEMSELIRFQHAYNASAKVLSVMDTMLEQLISIAGR